jgi:RNA polymerase sigma factor (sigma-70 family)
MMNRTSKPGRKLWAPELERYFNDIKNYPIYDYDEQQILAYNAMKGDSRSRDMLITSNLRTVLMLVKDFMHLKVPIEDLVSSGNEGLVRATKYYDPSKGCCFPTYASMWIRNCIMEQIEVQLRSVRVPNKAYKEMQKLYKHRDVEDLTELSKLTGISEKRIRDLRNWDIKRDTSPFNPQSVEEGPDYDLLRLLDKQKDCLAKLSVVEQQVLNMCWGLECNPLPLKTIAEVLGIPYGKVIGLKVTSMRKLRKLMQ